MTRQAGHQMPPRPKSPREPAAARRRRGQPPPSPRPGRPRSSTAHEAIVQSAVVLFIEQGFEGMSLEAVASRAGVGKATIYRRWSSKEDLVIDAVARVFAEPRMAAEVAKRSPLGRLYGERVIGPRRAIFGDALRRGIERGELPASIDIELAIDQLVGVLLLRKLTGRLKQADTDLAERAVDMLLFGLRAAGRGLDR
jgi:AcrR family transcriptional regulator